VVGFGWELLPGAKLLQIYVYAYIIKMEYYMKKCHSFYLFLIFACFILTTCFSPLDYHGGQGEATLSITLPGITLTERSFSTGTGGAGLTHVVTGTGPGAQSFTITARHGETVTVNVAVGRWTINVETSRIRNNENEIVASGSNIVEVRAGGNNNVEIKLYITNVGFIEEFLASQPGGTISNPINLNLYMPLTSANWSAIYNALTEAPTATGGKFVNLNLSRCTRSGDSSGEGRLWSNGNFDVAMPPAGGTTPLMEQVVSLTLPEAATSIRTSGPFVFPNLRHLDIGNGITDIINHVFENTQLISVTIPNNVDHIGNMAFANNNLLESVTFSKTGVAVAQNAFPGNLADIYIDFGAGTYTRTLPGGQWVVPPAIGNGTAGSPFQIFNETQLRRVGSGATFDGYPWSLDAHYRLMANINLDAGNSNNWTPIGSQSAHFTGVFDGNVYAINNLRISASTDDYRGLFGWIGAGGIGAAGIVRNVTLTNVDILGNMQVGGVAGFNDGTIENSQVTGTVSGTQQVGGIAGHNGGSIESSQVTGAIGGTTAASVGGIAGANTNPGSIESSQVTGTVSGQENVGGVAGFNTGRIENSHATSTVSGQENVGGVVGENIPAAGNIGGIVRRTSSAGNVTGAISNVGGVVGNNEGGEVEYSYFTGNVTGTADNVGGVVGNNEGTVRFSYSTGNINGASNVGGVVGRNVAPGGNGGRVLRTFSTGNVTGTDFAVGGIVGLNGESATEAGGEVRDSYSTGDVASDIAAGANVGGVVGMSQYGGIIQSCYAIGAVQGFTNVGGVVGNWWNQANPPVGSYTVGGCVALNSSVTAPGATWGRVFAWSSNTDITSAQGAISNNYGRIDMLVNGLTIAAANPPEVGTLANRHGLNVGLNQWLGGLSWWRDTVGLDTAIWDISNNRLPILRDMPGTHTQNPVVQP